MEPPFGASRNGRTAPEESLGTDPIARAATRGAFSSRTAALAEGNPMFSSAEIIRLLDRLGITHVVTVPDSTIGQWDDAIAGLPGVELIRVCREGEAWAVAAGLHLGGKRPLVLIQCT